MRATRIATTMPITYMEKATSMEQFGKNISENST